MPCKYKFFDYLNLDKLTYTPQTLIVGTFNPSWPEENNAKWFYGRTENNYFWEVLPKIYDEESLIKAGPKEWKAFCEKHKIAITDLISCIQDADEANPKHHKILKSNSDSGIVDNFSKIENIEIVTLLQKYPSIASVYLTRGCSESYWKNQWAPVVKYCTGNKSKCETLLTPSGNARFQLGIYKKQNPSSSLGLADFILMKWRERWL